MLKKTQMVALIVVILGIVGIPCIGQAQLSLEFSIEDDLTQGPVSLEEDDALVWVQYWDNQAPPEEQVADLFDWVENPLGTYNFDLPGDATLDDVIQWVIWIFPQNIVGNNPVDIRPTDALGQTESGMTLYVDDLR